MLEPVVVCPSVGLRIAVRMYNISLGSMTNVGRFSLSRISRHEPILERTRIIFDRSSRQNAMNNLSEFIGNQSSPPNKDLGSMQSSGDANDNSSSYPPNQTKRHSTRKWIKLLSIASLCLLILALYIHRNVQTSS